MIRAGNSSEAAGRSAFFVPQDAPEIRRGPVPTWIFERAKREAAERAQRKAAEREAQQRAAPRDDWEEYGGQPAAER